jgi:serine phosphatase RsbU (regulator of sigma subunit)/anti-sigma regulatory factor (Ser/Thr protein kinase)
MLFSNKVLSEQKFTFPAKAPYVADIKQKLGAIFKEYNFSYKDMNNMMVVLDEACSNIIKHAYKGAEGDIDFEVQVKEKGVYITIIDHGQSFNWKSFRTPNLNHYVDIGKKGGLGVWIIRKLTDKSDYNITPRGNELTLVKYHSKPSILNRFLAIFSTGRGIKEKFALATTMFIIILMGGIYWYFLQHERQVLKEKYILNSAETVRSVGQYAKDRMIKGNALPIIKLVQQIKKNTENVREVMVIDNTGKIIAHSDVQKLYTKFEMKDTVTGSRAVSDVQLVTFKDVRGEGYRLIEPITYQNIDIGEVHIVIGAEDARRVMEGKKANIIFVTLVVFALSVLGIYMLLGVIMKPLMQLKDGVIAIGEGRLDHKIELDGKDEFTDIANAFNDMANKFKGVQAELVEQEKVQKEIQVAKEIQTTLLPKDLPETEGFDIASFYRAARDVGGDYYDVMKVGPGLIGVIVADVSGKGVPGSLVMTITRTVVRLVANQNRSAKNVLVKVNNFVKEDMKKGMFVTAFYLVLDSLSRKINFACAGHDPLLIYRAKEDKVYWVKPKGFPLGISLPDDDLFRTVMAEETIKLQKDDLLLIYTDGVTEAMNGKREQFGEQRFVEAVKKYGKLTSREFIANLEEELKNFTQGYPQNDDITLVAVKEKKSESMVLNKAGKDIERLKKKGMTGKEIEKKLGINIQAFDKLNKKRKEKGREKEGIKFLTFEQKKDLMKYILEKPEEGVRYYTEQLSEKYKTAIDSKLIKNELKRTYLATVEARKTYSQDRK